MPPTLFPPLAVRPPTETRVLVLGGGPDAERDVSLESSQGVAKALQSLGYRVHREVIDLIDANTLRALAGQGENVVIFPVLHGPWGEGGPLQDELVASGLAFVGCGPLAARAAMDKMATKLVAARAGVPTLPACVLNTRDAMPPMPLPVVVKPIHEGSSVGVHICTDQARWRRALASVEADQVTTNSRSYMVEQGVSKPREVTVGWLDGHPLTIVEIQPGVEFYDYQAKYQRNDTMYVVDPALPHDLTPTLADYAQRMATYLGLRHLSRIDFLIDGDNRPWLLEVNTLPGFTSHSLLPMAAQRAGLSYSELASRLVQMALRDART